MVVDLVVIGGSGFNYIHRIAQDHSSKKTHGSLTECDVCICVYEDQQQPSPTKKDRSSCQWATIRCTQMHPSHVLWIPNTAILYFQGFTEEVLGFVWERGVWLFNKFHLERMLVPIHMLETYDPPFESVGCHCICIWSLQCTNSLRLTVTIIPSVTGFDIRNHKDIWKMTFHKWLDVTTTI